MGADGPMVPSSGEALLRPSEEIITMEIENGADRLTTGYIFNIFDAEKDTISSTIEYTNVYTNVYIYTRYILSVCDVEHLQL